MSHPSQKPKHHTPKEKPKRQDGLEWPNQPLPAETYEKLESQEEQDRRLVKRIQLGERDAMQELFHTYSLQLLRRIRRMLGGDLSQAEDCLQQVFLKVIQAIDSYRGPSLHSWLNRITTHTVIDVFRARQSRWNVLEKLKSFRLTGWSNDGNKAIPESMFHREQVRQILFARLETLNEQKRMVVLLCDLEGYTIEEAAIELDIPVGTIASRLYRARQELRVQLEQDLKKNNLSIEDWFDD